VKTKTRGLTIIFGYKIKELHLETLLHNDSEAYVSSGYGGKVITDWPFYVFISMWIGGRYSEAERLWVNWLLRQFCLYGSVEKNRGGMYQGSVHRYACYFSGGDDLNLKWSDPSMLDHQALCHGARELVERRLRMVDSIIHHGWRNGISDRIFAVEDGNGYYILKGGHHRAATLYTLGYIVLPDVYVYSKLGWRFLEWTEATRRFVCSKRQRVLRRG